MSWVTEHCGKPMAAADTMDGVLEYGTIESSALQTLLVITPRVVIGDMHTDRSIPGNWNQELAVHSLQYVCSRKENAVFSERPV